MKAPHSIEDRVAQLWLGGLPVPQIARSAGISANEVRDVIARVRAKQHLNAANAIRLGVPDEAIAERFGMSMKEVGILRKTVFRTPRERRVR